VPSLYGTRAVSVLCTATAIGLLVVVARRVGGKWAAYASCLALLATIPSLPYWLSITKTYALTCLFLAAIVFTLTSRARPAVRFPLAAVFAVGLTETRPTGVVLAVLLIAALLLRSPDGRTRLRLLLAAAVTALPFAFLIALDLTGARWGLFEYHQLGDTGDAGIGRFVSRTVEAMRAWPGPFLLGFAAIVVALLDREMRARFKRRLDLLAVAVGIVVFVLLHESSAHFFAEEYLSPLIAPLVVGSCVILVWVATRSKRRGVSIAARGVLVAGIAVTAFTGGHSYYLGAPGWRGDPAALSQVTKCVQRYSAPGDKVFAFSVEEVVVEANRRPVPGVTLGMFSYEDVSTHRAGELKILNSATIASAFRRAKVAVLTVDDVYETKRAGWFSKRNVENFDLYRAFQTFRTVCRVTLERPGFINRNHPVDVIVYARP
jgi:hypothetical protein